MSQLSTLRGDGRISTIKDVTTVYHVWKCLTTGTGDYQIGENLAWGADGFGNVLSWNPTLGELLFRRLLGEIPSVGVSLVGQASGTTRTLSSFGTGSPPAYTTAVSAGDSFHAHGDLLSYDVTGIPEIDHLTLESLYPTEIQGPREFTVQRDFTANRGFPILSPGDSDAEQQMGRFAKDVDSILGPGGPTQWIALPLSGDFAAVVGYREPGYFQDSNGITHLRGAAASPTLQTIIATLPAGFRPDGRCMYTTCQPDSTTERQIRVETSGAIQIQGASTTSGVVLDGISF